MNQVQLQVYSQFTQAVLTSFIQYEAPGSVQRRSSRNAATNTADHNLGLNVQAAPIVEVGRGQSGGRGEQD